uniref:Uncharacterized protein n=1 Tax=Ixodes ricinus TaxID=34613 RepID=A0A6B0UMK1_IXORI
MQSWGVRSLRGVRLFASVFARIMNGPFIMKHRRSFLSLCARSKTKLRCAKKSSSPCFLSWAFLSFCSAFLSYFLARDLKGKLRCVKKEKKKLLFMFLFLLVPWTFFFFAAFGKLFCFA